MHPLMVVTLKEIQLTLRDIGAIVWLLATPLILTLAVAAALGRGESPLPETPVLLLNQDAGQTGTVVAQAFQSEQFKGLVSLQFVDDADTARAQVAADRAAALVIIPPDFTDHLSQSEPTAVEVYASPARPIATSIVNSILSQIVSEIEAETRGTDLLVQELTRRGITTDDLEAVRDSFRTRLTLAKTQGNIHLAVTSNNEQAFSWLNYFAPSMAILFLTFHAVGAGRTFLDEKHAGTLSRLLVMPTHRLTILLGKMSGIALTSLLQMLALLGVTRLAGADWGDWRLAIAGIVALVICVTGLGAVIAAWSETPLQANIIGSAFLLAASALSGNFVPRMNLPGWMQSLSLVTPNAWGLELFIRLQAGAGLAEIAPVLGGTLGLGAGYYLLAELGFRRRLHSAA